jgi:predicted metal-dependent hydrolase
MDVIHPLWRKQSFRYGATVPPTGEIEVRRSARRRRTITARRDGDKTVVMVPAGLSVTEEQEWIATVLERLAQRERRRHPSDAALADRARELSARYLDGRAAPASVRWVSNQRSRWGSCTPDDGTIRLSAQLRGMPGWVVDYVLLHELTHLLVPGHGPSFWELVNRYSKTERARGYLEGVAATARLPLTDGEAVT